MNREEEVCFADKSISTQRSSTFPFVRLLLRCGGLNLFLGGWESYWVPLKFTLELFQIKFHLPIFLSHLHPIRLDPIILPLLHSNPSIIFGRNPDFIRFINSFAGLIPSLLKLGRTGPMLSHEVTDAVLCLVYYTISVLLFITRLIDLLRADWKFQVLLSIADDFTFAVEGLDPVQLLAFPEWGSVAGTGFLGAGEAAAVSYVIVNGNLGSHTWY